MVVLAEGQHFGAIRVALFEISKQSFISQIERTRILPVMGCHLVQAFGDIVFAHLDGELTPAIEAARSQIDSPDNTPNTVGQNHFGMQLEILEPVDLDSDVVADAQAAYSLNELFLLERMRRAGHEMNLHASARSSHQALDDDGVLVTLVLDEQEMPCVVDEFGNPIPPVGGSVLRDQSSPGSSRPRNSR
jgi:hypothetical protein